MSYVFKEVTVSGGNFNVEGTSACLNIIVDTMVTAGWSIEDDRRSQPGSTTLATHHKVVLVNNGGESGADANIYVTLTSGSSATKGQDDIRTQIGLAYDVGSHLVPTSGLPIPNATNPTSLTDLIKTDSSGYTNLWIGVDKDSLVVYSNVTATSDNTLMIGRCNRFLSRELEPYGTYIASGVAHNVVITNINGHFGNGNIHTVTTTNKASFVVSAPTVTQEPRVGLGQDKQLFTGIPITYQLFDTAGGAKGLIGYFPNVFVGVTSAAGLPRVGKMVVSGTGQEFRSFSGSTTNFLRVT